MSLRVYVSRFRDYGIVVSVAALFIVLSLASPAFLTKTNLLNILEQSAPVGVIAAGATVIIIGGNFDLSVGAVLAISGVFAALTANHFDPALGLFIAPLVGAAFGLFNAGLVTVLKVNSFMATLASSLMIRGFAALVTGGALIVVFDEVFETVGRGTVLSVRNSVLVLVGFAVLTGVLLARTTFGRHVYAVGGNPEAARLSGVSVERVQAATFVLSGFSAGLAGMIYSSRISTGQADAAIGIEFTAIAAVVIGGTSIFGGEGAVWRSMLGVLLLALIGNGFNILNVDPFYQRILEGGIIVFAVALDALTRRR
jgi:ribose transport system permease protein